MVKLRMTTVDVAAEVRCLRKLIGMRCANIYDLSPKTYVVKFAKSSGVAESGESEKVLALLESGVRLHTTEFARDKSSTPSGFTLKLRTHLRTRRLEDVRQHGIDRVVDFQFGLGDTAHHLIIELYAQGNIVLTDSNYSILQLLRTWKDEEKGISMMTRLRYPIDSCRVLEKTTAEKLDALFKLRTLPQPDNLSGKSEIDNVELDREKAKAKWGKDGLGKGFKGGNQENADSGKNAVFRGPTLKSLLGEALGYGPVLIEHIILDASLQPSMKIPTGGQTTSISDEDFKALVDAVRRFEDWLIAVVSGQLIPEGFIFMQKPNPGKKATLTTDENPELDKMQIYDEFYPLILKQLEQRDCVKFETFDAAVDEFFSKVEGQRAELQRKAQEDSAVSKLEKIRADQTKRVATLKKEVDQSVHMAELIEYNLDSVDAGISAVRAALASGMDWKDLGRMIKEEKKAGNPVAGLIHSLQLETNKITLLLSNNLDDMDEEQKTQPVDKVQVDLGLSAHANARHWFETKKRHATKQEKTLAAHEKAFKAAEKRTQQQLAQAKSVAAITHIRKVHWFEKFNWFISSENFLVISGRDAQQNELIVKRYMKKGDLYVHADLHGASSTIIKNRDPAHLIPPLTINQAGCFTVCRSQAWDSKIVTSAWWVEAHQVSKTAPTGEYLTVGSFMVRGKKNFLPPNPLVMGYGFLFCLDDSCIAAHLNERPVRGEEEGEGGSDEPWLTVNGKGKEKELSAMQQVEDEESDPTSLNDEIDEDVDGINCSLEENDVDDDESLQQVDSRIPAATQDRTDIESANGSKLEDLLDQALQLRSAPQIIKGSSKYELDDITTKDDFIEQLEVSKVTQREKPYLSKAERRKLKKEFKQQGDSLELDNTGDEMSVDELLRKDALQEISGTSVGSEESPAENKEENGPPTATKPSRGHKGKLKKIKGRYREQDEEERQLRMALLASAGRKEERVGSGNVKGSKGNSRAKTKEDVSRLELDLGLKVCYKCKMTGHIARDCPNNIADLSSTKNELATGAGDTGIVTTGEMQNLQEEVSLDQGRDVQGASKDSGKSERASRRAQAKAAKVEIAAIMAEENVMELNDDEKEKLTELDSLTGKPVPSDVLLYAVPVCAPYNALQGYKYSVKLTPGTAKRGKAAKAAVDVITHLQEVSAREKELIKAVTDPELVACMIGNSKVTAPGLSKLKQSQKKLKKVSAK